MRLRAMSGEPMLFQLPVWSNTPALDVEHSEPCKRGSYSFRTEDFSAIFIIGIDHTSSYSFSLETMFASFGKYFIS